MSVPANNRISLAKHHFHSPLESRFKEYFEGFFKFVGREGRITTLDPLSRSFMGPLLKNDTIGYAILSVGAWLQRPRFARGNEEEEAIDAFLQKARLEVEMTMLSPNQPIDPAHVYAALIIGIYYVRGCVTADILTRSRRLITLLSSSQIQPH